MYVCNTSLSQVINHALGIKSSDFIAQVKYVLQLNFLARVKCLVMVSRVLYTHNLITMPDHQLGYHEVCTTTLF